MIEEMLKSTIGWPSGVHAVPDVDGMRNKEYRMEHDSIGDMKVPADAYYGVQTLRAAENFPITGLYNTRRCPPLLSTAKAAGSISDFQW